jgi:putative heme transporter
VPPVRQHGGVTDVPAHAEPADTPAAADERLRAVRKQITRWLKILLFVFVGYYLVLPQIAGARNAAGQLLDVNPWFLVLGTALEILSLFAYTLLTRAALPPRGPGLWTLFRIQFATKAVTNTIPGGGAAGSALGYRLLTLAGVRGADAGFALATAGLGSAVVLNVLLWISLLVSIPTQGLNPLYVTAAIIGLVLMGVFAAIVVGLMKGQERAERWLRGIARRVKWLDEEKTGDAVRRIAGRLRELLSDPVLLRRVTLWATLNWMLDAAALWVFIRAFGGSVPPVGLIVSFCLANVFAAIPLTPGGLGIIEGILIPTLVGFGVPREAVVLGVPAWRLVQFWLPIPLGAIAYFTLRFGPGSVDRDRQLVKLREELAEMAEANESRFEWNDRFGHRPGPGDATPLPPTRLPPAGGGDANTRQ